MPSLPLLGPTSCSACATTARVSVSTIIAQLTLSLLSRRAESCAGWTWITPNSAWCIGIAVSRMLNRLRITREVYPGTRNASSIKNAGLVCVPVHEGRRVGSVARAQRAGGAHGHWVGRAVGIRKRPLHPRRCRSLHQAQEARLPQRNSEFTYWHNLPQS